MARGCGKEGLLVVLRHLQDIVQVGNALPQLQRLGNVLLHLELKVTVHRLPGEQKPALLWDTTMDKNTNLPRQIERLMTLSPPFSCQFSLCDGEVSHLDLWIVYQIFTIVTWQLRRLKPSQLGRLLPRQHSNPFGHTAPVSPSIYMTTSFPAFDMLNFNFSFPSGLTLSCCKVAWLKETTPSSKHTTSFTNESSGDCSSCSKKSKSPSFNFLYVTSRSTCKDNKDCFYSFIFYINFFK